MEHSNFSSQEQSTNKLNEVKNIIFGQDIRDYDQQLQLVKDNIKKNRAETLEKLEEVKNILLGAIKQTEGNLVERIEVVQKTAYEEIERQDRSHVSRQSFKSSLLAVSDAIMNE